MKTSRTRGEDVIIVELSVFQKVWGTSMSRFVRLNKTFILLITILIVGFYLRVFRATELMGFGHDSDVISWIVKDIVVNKHFRLVGQEISFQGIFIGPFYYYLLVPFYLLFGMNPVGGVYLSALLGVFNIWSFYYVFSKIFDKKAGFLAALFYSISFVAVTNDRGMIPTTPIIVWSLWYFYATDLFLKGFQKRSFVIFGILIGLIWHINVVLVLMLPSIIFVKFLSKHKLDLRAALYGLVSLFLISLPFLAFELRHKFPQLRSLANIFNASSSSGLQLLDRTQIVLGLAAESVTGLVFEPIVKNNYLLPVALFLVFVILVKNKLLTLKQALILLTWPLIILVFFSIYPVVLIEYYLNGMMIFWIVIIIIAVNYLLSSKRFWIVGVLLLIAFVISNISRVAALKSNKIGYVERRAVARYIKDDARKQNYPCVAVSHMSAPGYDLGYRYLFWLEDMHVNHPESGSPIYTIVFPTNLAGRVDKEFGVIGVVLPDRDRYETDIVSESCSGENTNLTDPMFKYSE